MAMSHDLQINGVYQHYKGNRYLVIAVARHSETMEDMVVYQTLYGKFDLWVRPLTMFLETVTVMIDGIETTQPRFSFIEAMSTSTTVNPIV